MESEAKVPEDVREILVRITRAFDRSDDRQGFVAGGPPAWTFPLDRFLVPEPAVLLFLLRDVLAFHDLGRFEKTAWECVFQFDGHAAAIAHRKLGVRLYVDRNDVPEQRAAQEMARAIKEALRRALEVLWRRFLQDYGRRRLESESVTIQNQAHRLRAMLDYFREGAELSYAGKGRAAEITPDGWHRLFPRETEGFFNSVAMTTSYFSWLEHVLVLSLAFHAEGTNKVSTFIRLPWGEKFRAIFDVRHDQDAVRVYKGLREVADAFRNPYAHGATDPNGGTVAFHLPRSGAVSMSVRGLDVTPSTWLLPFDERGFRRSRTAFDACDSLLHTSARTRLAMRWIESGMDVAYDSASRGQYRGATMSDEDFDMHLEAMTYLSDRATNMDW